MHQYACIHIECMHACDHINRYICQCPRKILKKNIYCRIREKHKRSGIRKDINMHRCIYIYICNYIHSFKHKYTRETKTV